MLKIRKSLCHHWKGVQNIMTKRERMRNVLANKPVDRVPVAFFHHFTEAGDWNLSLIHI